MKLIIQQIGSYNFIMLVVLLHACNESKTQRPEVTNRPQHVAACYQYAHNKDTILFTATFFGDSVIGNLVYTLYEKDRNDGNIRGKLIDDVIIADYKFTSEGIASLRQVALKKSKDGWAPGFGEVKVQEGKEVFLNRVY